MPGPIFSCGVLYWYWVETKATRVLNGQIYYLPMFNWYSSVKQLDSCYHNIRHGSKVRLVFLKKEQVFCKHIVESSVRVSVTGDFTDAGSRVCITVGLH